MKGAPVKAPTEDGGIAPPSTVVALVRLLRPLDWSKSSFVFAGLLFGHQWNDAARVRGVVVAFAAFCAVASSVYVFNDLLDRERDALHPTKRRRPIASGAVGVPLAVAMVASLATVGLTLAWWVSPAAFWLVTVYGLVNVAYTLRLKHVVLLDVFVIASGFVIRILVGTVGVDIPPSPWILVCGLTLSLFLGFCKRRAELRETGEDRVRHRQVLDAYSERDLEAMIGICAACAIITYCLYTIDEKTVATHGTEWLIATVPFVIYGILRYIHQLHTGTSGGRTATDMIRDPHLVVAILGWIAVTTFLLM